MATARMYELAYRFKESGLWKRLKEGEFFAVPLSDGETGYCDLQTGTAEGGRTAFAMSMYVGKEGYYSLRLLLDSDPYELDTAQSLAVAISDDYIQLAFEDLRGIEPGKRAEVLHYCRDHNIPIRKNSLFPRFTRFRPGMSGWPVETREDQDRICDALSAALGLQTVLKKVSKKKLGFRNLADPDVKEIPMVEPKGKGWFVRPVSLPVPEVSFPEPEFSNEVLAARLRRKPRIGTWECGMTWLPPDYDIWKFPKAPWFPAVLVTVIPEEGVAVRTPASGPDGPDELVFRFAEQMLDRQFAPKTICCSDGRTLGLLKDLCEKTGIVLEKNDSMEDLKEIICGLVESLTGGEKGEDSGWIDTGEEEGAGGEDLYAAYEEYDAEDDEYYDIYDDSEECDEEEVTACLNDLFASLRRMSNREMKEWIPDDVAIYLQFLAESGEMPEDLAKRIRKVFGDIL